MIESPSLEDVVTAFFAEAGGPGLLLPDGWFGGRPMENSHSLTFVTARPHHLIVELDDQLLLIFSGAVTAVIEQTELVWTTGSPVLTIGGYSQLVFDRLGYDDLRPHVTVFTSGTVRFVAAN